MHGFCNKFGLYQLNMTLCFVYYINNIMNRQFLSPVGSQIQSKISEIIKKIAQIAQYDSFEHILKKHRSISSQIIYYINYARKISFLASSVLDKIKQCMNLLSTILRSVQSSRFGHIFMYFPNVIRQCEKLVQQNATVDNIEKLEDRVEKNEQSLYYANTTKKLLTNYQDKEFIKNKKVQDYISCLSNGQILIPNQQCICCSQIYTQNMEIKNQNSIFSNILTIRQFNNNQVNLLKYVNGIINMGGGIILIGAKTVLGKIIPKGIVYKGNQMSEINGQIITQLSKNFPEFCFQIKFIRVQCNFLQKDMRTILDEAQRYCIRIGCFPKQYKKMHYIQIKSIKGALPKYEVYKLDEYNIPKLVKYQNNNSNLYQTIHKTYYKNIPIMEKKLSKHFKYCNSHQNIFCSLPSHSHFSRPYVLLKQNKINLCDEQQLIEDQEIQNLDQPKFKYQNSALLIARSKNDIRQIQQFIMALKLNKYKFQATIPFKDSFISDARQVWMLNFEKKFIELKQFFRQTVKPNVLILMPVYNQLVIQSSKLNKEHERYIKKRFTNRYKTEYETFQFEKQEKQGSVTYVSLNFSTHAQAIFAYLLFEQKQLKPYFVKDININKSNSKC